MGSGTLWLLIAVLWAAVLLPIIWRKRRDLKEERSVEDFRRAMGRLGRTANSGSVNLPGPARQAAARRRNVTIALGLFVLISGVAAALGLVPAIVLAVALIALALWLILAARAAMRLTQIPTKTSKTREKRSSQEVVVARSTVEVRSEVDVYVNEPIEIQALTRAQSMTMHPATLGWAAIDAPLPAHLRAPAVPVGQRVPGYEKPGSWSENVLEQLQVRKSVAEQLDLDAATDTQEIALVAEVPHRRAAGE